MCRHGSHRSDDWPERHLFDHVTLDVDSGGDFDQFQAFGDQAKDGSFRDEQNILIALPGDIPAERDLFDVIDEFSNPALTADRNPTGMNIDLQAIRCERATENQATSVLADVYESTDTGQSRSEA